MGHEEKKTSALRDDPRKHSHNNNTANEKKNRGAASLGPLVLTARQRISSAPDACTAEEEAGFESVHATNSFGRSGPKRKS